MLFAHWYEIVAALWEAIYFECATRTAALACPIFGAEEARRLAMIPYSRYERLKCPSG